MSYLWAKWREAFNAKNWQLANEYADLIDQEREDQKRAKQEKTKATDWVAQTDSEKTKRKPLWMKENS